MIDEEATADFGARMDVDSGFGVRYVGKKARDKRCTAQIERVREPMINDRGHSRITEQDLVKIARRRISSICGADVTDE